MIENEHIALWNLCLRRIRDNVDKVVYERWFEPIVPLQYENKELTIGVPSQFFYEILEEKYAGLLSATLNKEIGEGTQLLYRVLIDKTNGEST